MISVNNEKCDRDATITIIIIMMIGVIIDIIGEMLHTLFFFVMVWAESCVWFMY